MEILVLPQFSSVQSLSCVRLFVTPWTAVHQAPLSITDSRSLLKLMSIESVMPSNHLVLCCPLLLLPSIFPSIKSFPMSQFFASGGQSLTPATGQVSLAFLNPSGWLGQTWCSVSEDGKSQPGFWVQLCWTRSLDWIGVPTLIFPSQGKLAENASQSDCP